MSTLTTVSNFLCAQRPDSLCAPCIAESLFLSEAAVRNALQALVLMPGFASNLRLCIGCRETVEVVAAAPA
jgi:hypothetical protein